MSDLGNVPVRCDNCSEKVPVKRTTWAKDNPDKVICWLCAGITVICHECHEEVNKYDATEVEKMPGVFICKSCVREYEDEHDMPPLDIVDSYGPANFTMPYAGYPDDSDGMNTFYSGVER